MAAMHPMMLTIPYQAINSWANSSDLPLRLDLPPLLLRQLLGSLPIDGDPIKLNSAIHITCTILKLVAALASEAELGALFLNSQEAKVL
jgi:hypothetical protein